MIPYKVFPIFELGPLHFNMYGVMFALGFFIAFLLAVREAKKKGIKTDIIESLTLCILIGSIIGARLFYVFLYWPANMPLTFWDVFKVWEGGLAFFGGFIGAIISGYLYMRKHKLEFWEFVDLFTLPLIVGHILGRLGDYFTGGHHGKVTDLPWAIYLDGALRHPVVLYEIIGLIIIGLIIHYLKKTQRFDGFLFLVYVQLYSVQRSVLDFFRIEITAPRLLGITTQHVIVVLFVVASCLVVVRYRKNKIKCATSL